MGPTPMGSPMAEDEEFGYSGLVEWRPGQPFDDAVPVSSGRHRPAWYRDPRILVGLIAAAMAVLVVASVLLLTNGRLGEQISDTEMTPRAPIRTSAATSAVTAPQSSPPADAATTSMPSTSETTGDSPADSAGETSGALGGAPEPDAPSPAPASPTARPDTPEGPRTNVTRNPMSFTPGAR